MEAIVNNKQVKMLNLDEVLPNRFQPRIKFDEHALDELTNSIKTHGVIQPIIVRPLGDKYEIIAGERRYKASTLANLKEIPAIVVDMNDKESAEVALMENVQRQDLTPIEEAISYKKILDMGYIKQEDLATKLGKNQSTIANKLRLLNLSDNTQEALLQGKISERHARSLLKIKDFDRQNTLLSRIIEERLTVRKTDEEIEKMINGKNDKDIEVLDFDFSDNISKTPEQPDPLDKYENLYNIPSSPIVEDKEDEFIPVMTNVNVPKQEDTINSSNNGETNKVFSDINVKTSINYELDNMQNDALKGEIKSETLDKPVFSEENIATNDINPGFMDISKIESEAASINNEPKKTSLDDLLKSPDKVVSTETIVNKKEEETTEPKEEKIPMFDRPGRFFTMVDDDQQNASFEPKFELNNSDNLKEENSQIENSKENVDIPQFNISADNNPSDSNVFGDAGFPTFEFNADVPVSNETENIDNQIKFDAVPTEEEKLREFKMPPLENNSYVTPNNYKPIVEENNTSVQDNGKYGTSDLRTVINTIRNCASTIEKYGFEIDVEEFDFEDMYQAIFKIQKKK